VISHGTTLYVRQHLCVEAHRHHLAQQSTSSRRTRFEFAGEGGLGLIGGESFRSRCYERMLSFRENGKTLILVTHDLGAISSFCDRAIWLDEGRVRGEGTPESITRRYVAEVTEQEELWSAQQAAASCSFSFGSPGRGMALRRVPSGRCAASG